MSDIALEAAFKASLDKASRATELAGRIDGARALAHILRAAPPGDLAERYAAGAMAVVNDLLQLVHAAGMRSAMAGTAEAACMLLTAAGPHLDRQKRAERAAQHAGRVQEMAASFLHQDGDE